ncbi:replication protein [Clostridium chromiireducens]|uniref:Replication protein n=1 Tax=Clostridium chromiireducens TaxID=225345 RepID=A0A399IIR0_9CLOT|nr:replication protein [Clostridium chromiireducens]RII32129.1 replication protein [Clostridium chromiireducens]
MADRIKGITIEIDGEVTGLKKSLSDVTSQSISIQKELTDVNRLLKFDPGNTAALAQKQELLGKQVEITSQKLKALKDAQSQVDEQFAKGEIGEQQYRAFQREIQFTEASLGKLKQSLAKIDDGNSIKNLKEDMSKIPEEVNKAEESVKGLGNELTNLAAGAAAGMGIGEIVEKSLEASSLNTQIDISFNVPEESVQSVKNAISTVETYGVDSESAIEGVRRQWALNKDASDESNAAVVQGAATIVAAYGDVDFTELIQETNELSKTLRISDQDALALTYSLLQMGFPPDQLDIITEYGTQLKMAGYNAQEIQAIMAAGVDTGTWNIDNLLDGLKEGRIRMAEFGVSIDNTTAGLLKNTSISQQQLQSWGQAVAKGGEDGTKAMQEVAQALTNVSDDTTRNALGVQLFGTMWEDQGSNITNTLLGMNDHLMSTEENQNKLNSATESLNSNPIIQMQTAISNLMTALAPVLTVISNIIEEIAKFIADNPTLASTIASIVSVVGILIGVMAGLAPIITAISTAGISAASVTGALGAAITALTGPIGIVIAVIAGFVAAFVALYNNNEGFRDSVNSTWDQIKTTISEVITIIQGIIAQFVQVAQAIWAQFGDDIAKVATDVWNGISAVIQTVLNVIKDLLNVALALIKGDWQGAWEGIKQLFSDVWNGILALLQNILTSIADNINLVFGNIISTVTTWGSNMLTTATTGMQNVFDGIVNTFTNLPSKMVEIGTNIVAGIKQGIVDAWNGMTGWIGGLCDSFTDGVKDALDIHSPSRVMRALGNYTGEGFGLGIGDTIGSISRQANALASAAIPNVNAGSYELGLNASGGGIGSASNLDRVLSAMESMVSEISSLKEAFNVTLNLDGQKVGKMITPAVSSNLAFNSGRKGW